uniref:Immunoglobulin domain-containing protein n=1 Tax=Anabas testudineus TaxID=64144 RepID=A0A7N6ATE1_ANATE
LGTASALLEVSGHVGGEVSILCSASWTTDSNSEHNNMYFCKGICSRDNILIQTERERQSGRITLVDWRNGTITVSISQVQLSDAGTYWCGVDRPGLDTFTAVTLTVKKSKGNVYVYHHITATSSISVAHTEAATVPPGVSPKRTTRKILRATQLISEMDTSGPSYVSTSRRKIQFYINRV